MIIHLKFHVDYMFYEPYICTSLCKVIYFYKQVKQWQWQSIGLYICSRVHRHPTNEVWYKLDSVRMRNNHFLFNEEFRFKVRRSWGWKNINCLYDQEGWFRLDFVCVKNVHFLFHDKMSKFAMGTVLISYHHERLHYLQTRFKCEG